MGRALLCLLRVAARQRGGARAACRPLSLGPNPNPNPNADLNPNADPNPNPNLHPNVNPNLHANTNAYADPHPTSSPSALPYHGCNLLTLWPTLIWHATCLLWQAATLLLAYERRLVPDESLLQTAAMHSPHKASLLNHNLRWIDWPHQHGDAQAYWNRVGKGGRAFVGGPQVRRCGAAPSPKHGPWPRGWRRASCGLADPNQTRSPPRSRLLVHIGCQSRRSVYGDTGSEHITPPTCACLHLHCRCSTARRSARCSPRRTCSHARSTSTSTRRCWTHYIVHDTVHCIMHCIVHCTVHCTVHCIVHYTVQYIVHYIIYHYGHLGDVGVARDGDDRAELLLGEEPHARPHAVHHCGGKERAW